MRSAWADHEELHVIPFPGARRGVADTNLHDGLTFLADPRSGHECHAGQGMVDQVGADTRQIHGGHDTERLQIAPGPDAGPEQDGRRGDGSGRDGDPPASNDLRGAGARDFHAYRSASFEDHAAHEAIRPDGSGWVLARGEQIADGGGHAQAIALVYRPRPDARGLRVIASATLAKPRATPASRKACWSGSSSGVFQRRTGIGPPRPWSGPASSWSSSSLRKWGSTRDHAHSEFPRLGRLVVVGGHATEHDGGVHGRGAAGDLAARVLDLAAFHGVGLEAPVVANNRYPGAVAEILRQRLDGGVVRSGLQQQDAAAGSSDSRAASTAPLEPAPTMISSYVVADGTKLRSFREERSRRGRSRGRP